MATPVSIAIRRSDALERVATATRTIADATGADIADFPEPHKQEAMRPAIEAEWLADALESIAGAVGPSNAASTAPQAPSANETADKDAKAALVQTVAAKDKGR